MASSKPISCGPCQEGNTKADVWCPNCEEGLCSTCFGHHKRSKGTRDHKTIDIKSYIPSFQAITTECDKHGQQLNLYCPSHLMPCCDECISRSHSKCTGIKNLANVAKKTKIGKSKESIEKDINSILHLLDKMVNNKSTSIKTGEQQRENIKKSVLKIREKIDKHLDHIEKKLGQEVDNVFDQEKSKATDFVTEIEGKKTNLQKIQHHLHSVTTHTPKLQSFLGVHQIEQQVHQYQRYAEDLENDDRAKEFDIKMKQNDVIEKILRKLQSLESLGESTVAKIETLLNRETSVRRDPQVESQEQSNINNMAMNLETYIEINMRKYISDMMCLMDGRVIVAELDGKVYLHTSKCNLEKQLQVSGGTYSVTQINQNTIAITYPKEMSIKIFNMENENVTKVIKLNKPCYSLSFYNNSLAVGLNNDEIRIIDVEGKTLKSIQVQNRSNLVHLVYCNDRVIYSDYKGGAVYCVDKSGKQIWKYKQDLSQPRGLCTDTNGNIIVADSRSHKVIVISKDGQDSKVMNNPADGLENPRCICFKHNESSVFLCDGYGTCLAKFNIYT